MTNQGVIMTALTTTQPAQADIIRMIESNPRLAATTKAQYKKAISYTMVGWYAKTVGLVKQETYDQKGKLSSTMELTKWGRK